MSYTKVKFRNGVPLTAKHMNDMEDAIIGLETSREQENKIIPSDYSNNSPILKSYIRNRPFWFYSDYNHFTWDGVRGELEVEGMMWIEGTDSWEKFSMMENQSISYSYKGKTYEGVAHVVNNSNVNDFEQQFMEGTLPFGVYVLDYGDLSEGMPNLMAEVLFYNADNIAYVQSLETLLGMWITPDYIEMIGGSADFEIKPGFYSFSNIICEEDPDYLASFREASLNIETVLCDNRYQLFFDNLRVKNYPYSIEDSSFTEYAKYPSGSVVLLVNTAMPVET